MTFLHISLLLGGLLAIVPIVMHMMGRRQPKPITFPAIRFVRQTAITAQRGWSIKRWLLLALRTLLVLLLAVALASPRVHSADFANFVMIGVTALIALLATAVALTAFGARKSRWISGSAAVIACILWAMSGSWFVTALGRGGALPLPNSSGPICAAIVLDTSPVMGYRYHDKTRLDEAKEMARWLMDRLPVGSQIAIVANDAGVRLNQDRLSAERQLERSVVDGHSANLIQRISASIDVLRTSELDRREIYVLTDLSESAWRDAERSEVATKLATKDGDNPNKDNSVLVQIIDVGVPRTEIRNWSIRELKMSQQSTVPGGQVTITAEISANHESTGEQLTVELLREDIDRKLPIQRDGKTVVPESRVVDRQLIEVPAGGSVPVKLSLKELPEGTNHAELRLSRTDPLEVDNVYYISIDARMQGKTLVVSDDARDGKLVSLMISPAVDETTSKTGEGEESVTSNAPTVEPASKLGITNLSKYSSIILYNPGQLQADDVDRISQWVDGGGGLLIVLGSAFSNAEAMMNSPLASLLPGTVKRQSRRPEDSRSMYLAPVVQNHPIWSIFERPVEEIPWGTYPVFKHWDIESLDEQAAVLMRFTDSDQPALIEWVRKQGRILVMSTPYPEPASHSDVQPWNELYRSSSSGWPGYALFLGTTRYLASANKHQLNYYVDSTVFLENNPAQYPPTYELFTPQNETVRADAAEDVFSYSFTKSPGHYRMRGSRPQGPMVRGFSVNVDRNEISLVRVPDLQLDRALGKGLYRIAKDKAEVQSSIGEGRYGRELSPMMLVALVAILLGEQVMASRFYASSAKRGA